MTSMKSLATHLLKPLPNSSLLSALTHIAPAFGQEPIPISRVEADNDTLAGEMEDGHAGADGEFLAWEGGGDGFGGLDGHCGAMSVLFP